MPSHYMPSFPYGPAIPPHREDFAILPEFEWEAPTEIDALLHPPGAPRLFEEPSNE